jgi:hypothetical protein
MTNWLHECLRDAVERKLCVQIYCTTCDAREFRLGVLRALAATTEGKASTFYDVEASGRVTQALVEVVPDDKDRVALLDATRCLVFDLCSALGESAVGQILGAAWAGEVLQAMQEHSRARAAARQAQRDMEANAPTRRAEKKRAAAHRHAQRLALKVERDKPWRQKNGPTE